MHISCEYHNGTLYYNKKIGYGYIWGEGGGPKVPKMSEFDDFVEFGAHLEGRRTP